MSDGNMINDLDVDRLLRFLDIPTPPNRSTTSPINSHYNLEPITPPPRAQPLKLQKPPFKTNHKPKPIKDPSHPPFNRPRTSL